MKQQSKHTIFLKINFKYISILIRLGKFSQLRVLIDLNRFKFAIL